MLHSVNWDSTDGWIRPIWDYKPKDLEYFVKLMGDSMDWKYTVNEDSYVCELDLPGHTDIKVSGLSPKDYITLEGWRRGVRKFRDFSLPLDAAFDEGKAVYKDGVLTVTIPRKKVETPKTIKVEFG